jgi:hypothetical protein
VFNGIQVRQFGRPWKHIDVVLLKVVHCYTRCVWPSVVLLENPICRSITCMSWGWINSFLCITVLNCMGHALGLFCGQLRHYFNRSYPLPEHTRKRNVHSGAYVPVYLQKKTRRVAEPNSSPVSECPAS